MNTDLIIYDVDLFLDKYTRFMTKNIYITNKMYQRFLSQYNYLFEKLKINRFLYQDNIEIQKVMNIIKNQAQLIKLHNKKYLETALKNNQSFFDSLNFEDKLDIRKKTIILSEEENLLTIQPQHNLSLIIGKIQFLLSKKEYLKENILVLTENTNDAVNIKKECLKRNIEVPVYNIKKYGYLLLKEQEKLIEYQDKYNILNKIIIHQLFPNKELFKEFYQAFSKYIYLNKDYLEYETFHDYHNYMYKRKFLLSNLNLKKFNEQEVNKKKDYLRTIKNETVKQKEEVDIANFLYLNSCDYHYDSEKCIFSLDGTNKKIWIKFLNDSKILKEKNTDIDDTIYLYSSYKDNKTYLEVLAYELIKRRYPLEKISDEELYQQLKETTINNYFSEFIYKYLIPIIDYYEESNSFDDTRLTSIQQDEFIYLYNLYDEELKKNNYVKEVDLLKRIKKEIKDKKYQYLFLIGDIPLNCNIKTFTVLPDYQEVELLKENIKLLYDYKKYLYANQYLPIAHTYLNKEEIKKLTTSFIKENLSIINENLESTKKEIQLHFYDDTNRLHVYRNISQCCHKVLENLEENTLLALRHLKDMNLLIGNNFFFKEGKNTLLTSSNQKIECEEINNISKLYQRIILPYLIVDNYHEELLKKDYHYYLKVMLYISLNKCRKELILLCPTSRKNEIKKLLKNLNNLVICE